MSEWSDITSSSGPPDGKFADAFNQNEYLTNNLKEEVAKKTQELEIEKMMLIYR